jgi:hypothetical protein
MSKDVVAVLGHLCEGLQRFQEAGGACKPRLKANGISVACDDHNPIALTHCPFCGVLFTEAGEPPCHWTHCNCTPKEHEDQRAWLGDD